MSDTIYFIFMWRSYLNIRGLQLANYNVMVNLMRFRLFLTIFLCFQVSVSFADKTAEDAIRITITNTFPDIDVTGIKKSPINGLYEVLLGPELVYASSDGRYILQGDLIDMKQKRNLSEELRAQGRMKLLANISESEYIEFSPVAAERKHTVYVFTDIDCGYCRRLHKDMPDLNRKGIAVRYLAFPRAGTDTAISKQMDSVWCSKNQKKAMNEAKQGMRVSKAKCNSPVARQFALGQDMGVRGTPAIFTESGVSISGYMPPDKLLQALNAQ
jgi:thiol:disulfide interchange protein DsbC